MEGRRRRRIPPGLDCGTVEELVGTHLTWEDNRHEFTPKHQSVVVQYSLLDFNFRMGHREAEPQG